MPTVTRAAAGADAATLEVVHAARLFHALSDETRLAIVERLRAGERCVCDLTDLLDAAQSRLSFHLRVLREAGLVADRREGRWVYYTLRPEAFAALETAVKALKPLRGAGARGQCCG
jgi:ArsR family transcriptional regulator, arsenate/arsenite/antimonite-responsive transcriptional repressor